MFKCYTNFECNDTIITLNLKNTDYFNHIIEMLSFMVLYISAVCLDMSLNLSNILVLLLQYQNLPHLGERCSHPLFISQSIRPVAHIYSIDHLSLLSGQQKRLKFSLIWKHQQKSSHFRKSFLFHNHLFCRNLPFLCGIDSVILCISGLVEFEKLLIIKKGFIDICNSERSKQSLAP